MIYAILRLIFWLQGWKVDPNFDSRARRSVLIAIGHTSNWDFVYAFVAWRVLKINARFTIKKEFNKFLIGPWLKSMGALWIDRSPKVPGEPRPSMVQVMTDLMMERPDEEIAMLVTVEGTRSLVTKWKTGFYHVAKGANVPIALGYIDYENKRVGIPEVIIPTDDMDADMRKIVEFYRKWAKPKFPEKFGLDERYTD